MEIIIVTGQRNGNLYLAGNYEHVKYFPEQSTLHPYKLSETGHCDILKCISCMDNGETRTSTFNEYGEMGSREEGIFDIKRVILKELLDIKRGKMNS